jgi:DNA-binding transcriptional ArsR family regulator
MTLRQPSAADGAEGTEGGERVFVVGGEQSELLDLLGDRRSRAIVDATAGRAMTAAELSERLDIPLSTLYRKVDALADTPLLEKEYRFADDGKHPAQYRCPVRRVSVETTGPGERDAEVRVSLGED